MTRRALKTTIEQGETAATTTRVTTRATTTISTATTTSTTTTDAFKLCPLFVAALIHQLKLCPLPACPSPSLPSFSAPTPACPCHVQHPFCQVPFKVLAININIIFYCLRTTRHKSRCSKQRFVNSCNAQLATIFPTCNLRLQFSLSKCCTIYVFFWQFAVG